MAAGVTGELWEISDIVALIEAREAAAAFDKHAQLAHRAPSAEEKRDRR